MNRLFRNTLALGAFALLGLSRPANAQPMPGSVIFTADTTVDYIISNPIHQFVGVGDANSSPTVNFINGCSVQCEMSVYNASTLNLSGGFLFGQSYGFALLADKSTMNVTGGSMNFAMTINVGATLNVSGGDTSGTYVIVKGTLNISGGDGFTRIDGPGTINISGYGNYGNISSSGVINRSGGSMGTTQLGAGGTINYFGAGLSRTLIDAGTPTTSSTYRLSGKLADGTDITGETLTVPNNANAAVTFNDGPSVTGALALDGIAANAGPQMVTFTFRPADGSPSLTRTIGVSPSGTFALSGFYQKKGILHIKADKYLAVNTPVDFTNGKITGLNVTLLAGDIDNDNSIGPGDFNIFISAYNSDSVIPGSGYDPRADLDGDGSIGPTDFAILVENYNSQGDL